MIPPIQPPAILLRFAKPLSDAPILPVDFAISGIRP